MTIKNKNFILNSCAYLFLSIFFIHQIFYISKGGTTWDDLEILITSERVIDKAYWFFVDRSNSFLGDFNFNLEFYGYLVPMFVYLVTSFLSNNGTNLFIFKNLIETNIYSDLDLIFLTRNLAINLYVVLSLIIIYKLIIKKEEIEFGLIFLIFLILIPTFNGHALFNIKDIPFAIQYFLAVVLIIDFRIDELKINKKNILSLIFFGLIFGFVVLVRFNAYAFLFLLSFYMFCSNYRSSIKNLNNIFINWFVIYAVSFLILILLSPSSWNNPIFWLRGVIETQFSLDWEGGTLTNGTYILATEMQSSYLFNWFIYRLPVVYLLIFLLSFFLFLTKNKTNYSSIGKYSVFIIISVFLLFSAFRPVSYDGIRQYIFLLPFFAVLSSEVFLYLKEKFGNKIYLSFLFLSIIYLIGTQFSLNQYKYVYFNEFVNEDEITIDCQNIGGCGNWETDYWGYSIKELLSSVNLNGSLIYCEPKHIFETYDINKKTSDSSNIIFVASIHRDMNKSLCNSKIYELKNCKIYYKEEALLRMTSINLSYVYQCEENT